MAVMTKSQAERLGWHFYDATPPTQVRVDDETIKFKPGHFQAERIRDGKMHNRISTSLEGLLEQITGTERDWASKKPPAAPAVVEG